MIINKIENLIVIYFVYTYNSELIIIYCHGLKNCLFLLDGVLKVACCDYGIILSADKAEVSY